MPRKGIFADDHTYLGTLSRPQAVGQPVSLRSRPGDHSYYFISSHMKEHVDFHASARAAQGCISEQRFRSLPVGSSCGFSPMHLFPGIHRTPFHHSIFVCFFPSFLFLFCDVSFVYDINFYLLVSTCMKWR